jgi:alpha-D-xyloside xylohydrolase
MLVSSLLVLVSSTLSTGTTAPSGCGTASGALVEVSSTLVIGVCDESVLRVVRAPKGGSLTAKAELMARKSLMVSPEWPAGVPKYTVKRDAAGNVITITTSLITATIKPDGSTVTFSDPKSGAVLTAEVGTSNFTPTKDPALPQATTYVVEQSFSADEAEGLYGGGEFQNGLVEFRGVPIQLVQFNTEAAVPFFSSTKGYGLLWDSNAWTHLNPPTGRPLTFNRTASAPSSSPFPVSDGTGVVVAPCARSGSHVDPLQQWAYSAKDKLLSLNSSATEVLDCDGCALGHSPHLWHVDSHFAANQQWEFTKDGRLKATQKSTCLGVATHLGGSSSRGSVGGAGAVQMESCTSGTSRWNLDPGTGLLSLASLSRPPLSSAAAGGPSGRAAPDVLPAGSMCLAASTGEQTAHFTPRSSGDHYFYVDMCPGRFGCGFNQEVYLSLTDPSTGAVQVVQEWDKLTNLPDSIAGAARNLKSGVRYTVTLISSLGLAGGVKVYVAGPDDARRTVLRSELGSSIDYYMTFTGRASLDGAIQGYRTVTGAAPLYAKWAYGFWQCKEHYQHQSELLGAAKMFRDLSIPLDAIVQDWHYWGNLGWGPHWDPAYYPDPAAMVSNLTANHLKLMVSVWSKFDTSTTFFANMTAQKYMIGDLGGAATNYYDVWSDGARELFYQFSKEAHFSIGVESLWLDATEPENFPNVDHPVASDSDGVGSGNLLMNSYSLKTTQAIADGLRRDFGDAQGRRVFSLTRSSTAGQQRYGAALWSGDISSTWDSLRRQVAAALNYQASGIPYWSEDIGGFFRPHDAHTDPSYHRLLIRWFQYGAFTPIFRVHGSGDGGTELWLFGNETMESIVASAVRPRYSLLPYTYSGFAKVMREGWTMQRLLAFDFADDPLARTIGDQFMYGECLMIAPVLEDSLVRSLYLPQGPLPREPSAGGGWFNVWTGELVASGMQTNVSAPLLQVPAFAKRGSLLAIGPNLQHTGEQGPVADPLEIRVYDGADASFTLYEDDGLSADFGAHSTIDFRWDEGTSTLSISAYGGAGFPGRKASRTFNLIRVRGTRGAATVSGFNQTWHGGHLKGDQQLTYTGEAITVKL